MDFFFETKVRKVIFFFNEIDKYLHDRIFALICKLNTLIEFHKRIFNIANTFLLWHNEEQTQFVWEWFWFKTTKKQSKHDQLWKFTLIFCSNSSNLSASTTGAVQHRRSFDIESTDNPIRFVYKNTTTNLLSLVFCQLILVQYHA